MMRPLMMKFRQGAGDFERDIWVNMNMVCHITPGGQNQSVLTFAAAVNDEPAYVVVNESPDKIGARYEWQSP